jgi:hypothetical protein
VTSLSRVVVGPRPRVACASSVKRTARRTRRAFACRPGLRGTGLTDRAGRRQPGHDPNGDRCSPTRCRETQHAPAARLRDMPLAIPRACEDAVRTIAHPYRPRSGRHGESRNAPVEESPNRFTINPRRASRGKIRNFSAFAPFSRGFGGPIPSFNSPISSHLETSVLRIA